MEPESFTDFLKRVRDEKKKGANSGCAEFIWDGFTATKAETATRTAQFKFEEFIKATIADDIRQQYTNEFYKYWVGVDLASEKPSISARQQAKIKKLEAMISDSSTTPGEKENAKRLIEKIKAGV